ncbi:Serine/threonine-protein kinase [Ceratobasidium sp. AG-Ba]|nr:Serine/threonine-protein kinase [Ceratobasidium sp. AG-Ba]QRW11047.1 Serine/threonine-protein kinase [Ceratobasidium sp. AG-Ba]
MSYGVQPLLPDLWEAYYFMDSGIDQRTSVCRYQWYALRDQLKVSVIAAETCYSQGAGDPEIQRLKEIILATNQFLYEARHEGWAAAMHMNARFNQFISNQARLLDRVLSGFANILNSGFGSTVALIEQAKVKDDNWIHQFVAQVDKATPAPGSFTRAYREGNYDELDVLATQVLNEQTRVLSTPFDLQPRDVHNARELTNWIMNITKKRPAPSILLGQRFIGAFKHYRSTAKYELYLSKFVTGETVVIKALRQNLPGKSIDILVQRFQNATEVVHSLRSDYTLPFYGIGKSDINGQTLIYSVSPYLPNGDAVAFHQVNAVAVTKSLQIACDVARALDYLHGKSPPIVHSGVRTDNILIANDGRGILAGFGLIQEANTDTNLSHTGSNDFHRYLAPEHLGPSCPQKPSGDIVGGRKPFDGMNDFQAATQVANGQRPKRDNYPRAYDIIDADGFWQLLDLCWAQEESERPDMSEVVFRMTKLCKANRIVKPLPTGTYEEAPNIDEPLYDGKPTRPVAQGPRPRHGGTR